MVPEGWGPGQKAQCAASRGPGEGRRAAVFEEKRSRISRSDERTDSQVIPKQDKAATLRKIKIQHTSAVN